MRSWPAPSPTLPERAGKEQWDMGVLHVVWGYPYWDCPGLAVREHVITVGKRLVTPNNGIASVGRG